MMVAGALLLQALAATDHKHHVHHGLHAFDKDFDKRELRATQSYGRREAEAVSRQVASMRVGGKNEDWGDSGDQKHRRRGRYTRGGSRHDTTSGHTSKTGLDAEKEAALPFQSGMSSDDTMLRKQQTDVVVDGATNATANLANATNSTKATDATEATVLTNITASTNTTEPLEDALEYNMTKIAFDEDFDDLEAIANQGYGDAKTVQQATDDTEEVAAPVKSGMSSDDTMLRKQQAKDDAGEVAAPVKSGMSSDDTMLRKQQAKDDAGEVAVPVKSGMSSDDTMLRKQQSIDDAAPPVKSGMSSDDTLLRKQQSIDDAAPPVKSGMSSDDTLLRKQQVDDVVDVTNLTKHINTTNTTVPHKQHNKSHVAFDNDFDGQEDETNFGYSSWRRTRKEDDYARRAGKL